MKNTEKVLEENIEKKSYAVRIIKTPNRESFNGNPDVETNNFDTLEDATHYYKELEKLITSDYGLYSEIQLIDNSTNERGGLINEEPLELNRLESAKIPEGSVIVTFKHVKHMNYAYKIIDVKFSRGEKYKDLNDNEDSCFANWDCVLESVEELKKNYEEGHSQPFDKMNSGSEIIEEFLSDNGYRVFWRSIARRRIK